MRSGSLHEQVSTSRRSLRLVCQSRTTSSQRSKSTVKQASSDRTATTGLTRKQETKSSAASRFYAFITGFPFPLGPLFQRKTCRYEVVKDTIWTFEQTQALENFCVYTPVRMTVIRLKTGGLWVHAPVAPTDECVHMLKELGGDVEYIILPTFAYEHKAFVGPFSRKFPKAKVYTNPYQWSFPLNLPNQFYGIFSSGNLVSDDKTVPWADEIEQKLLLPPSIGVGDFVRTTECAFFHKRSKTLLVTDAVVYIDDKVPETIPREDILEIARDNALARFVAGGRSSSEIAAIADTEKQADTEENRIRGWRRMSLLVLYFSPSDLLTPDASFEAISNTLIVPPVVETLVYSKIRTSVREWVDSIVRDWAFTSIIPCHFTGPVKSSPAEFKRAFSFVYEEAEADVAASSASGGGFLSSLFGRRPEKLTRPVVFPPDDIRALTGLNDILLSTGLVKRNADLGR